MTYIDICGLKPRGSYASYGFLTKNSPKLIYYDISSNNMKYNVNWKKTKDGNGAKEGSKVQISCSSEAESPAQILFGVYQNGFPVIIGQKPGGKIDFKLSRKGMSLKGEATLKVTCYDSKWRSFGWKDDFNIF